MTKKEMRARLRELEKKIREYPYWGAAREFPYWGVALTAMDEERRWLKRALRLN
jgi:hypothetical protein